MRFASHFSVAGRNLSILAPLPLGFVCSGCITFSNFQTARIVQPGQSRATMSYSRNNVLEEDRTDAGWNVFEMQFRHNLVPNRADWGGKMSLLMVGDGAGAILGFDGKVAIVPDYIAFSIPVSALVGDVHFFSLQFHPGLIGTVRFTDQFDITGAAKRVFFARAGDHRPVYAFNIGFGVSDDLDRWAIRPEIGWLTNFGDEPYFQFGVAIEPPVSWRKRDREN